MRRVTDNAVYALAALAAIAMVASMLLAMRSRQRQLEQAPKPMPVPVPKPKPMPKTTPEPEGADEIALSPEEKVPPVPMPEWPGHRPRPSPTSTSQPYGNEEIDKGAAKAALASVPYKDCGVGGAGKVQVTFGPNGSVMSAAVTSGDYDSGTKACIQNRFKGAHVPPYDGAPKSFGWSINL